MQLSGCHPRKADVEIFNVSANSRASAASGFLRNFYQDVNAEVYPEFSHGA